MARQLSFRQLLQQLEPTLRRLFFDAVRQARGVISANEIARLVEAGDVEAALDALHFDRDVFDQMAEGLRQAYLTGGNNAVLSLKPPRGARVPIRFGGYVPETARELAEHSSRLVTEITEDTRAGMRAVIEEGYRQGWAPTRTARTIVGPIGKNNRRSGGLIGLHSQQVDWAIRARAEVFSGDAEGVANYLTRKARDRRYDGFMRAVRDMGWDEALRRWEKRNGYRISKSQMIDRIAGRYADRLLKVRGNTIARTETLWAMRSSQFEAVRQQIDSGKIDAAAVTLVWDATGDARTRPSHMAMEGQTVGWGEAFTTPGGHQMRFPGDPSLGAPGSETIQCRCVTKVRVDWYRGLR